MKRIDLDELIDNTASDVRATVQSFLAQAEYFGEILLGIGLGLLAQATSIAVAMMGGAALVTCAGVLVLRSRAGRAPEDRSGAEVDRVLLHDLPADLDRRPKTRP